MIRTLVTIFAALLGLAFGSFLNVCLSRWPEGESVVHPRSHCRNCEHVLAWWENIPLLSWVMLRGRCRRCKSGISIRYPLVELSVGVLWASVAWAPDPRHGPLSFFLELICIISILMLYWLTVALAFLDAENFWLPNFLTFPGIALGFIFTVANGCLNAAFHMRHKLGSMSEWMRFAIFDAARNCIISILVAAGLLLVIRWLYWIFRHREGMGLGDVKLIAMLAAWLGLPLTLLAFFVSSVLGAIAGLVVIAMPSKRDGEDWATAKLPFGTFLCIGGIVSSLWGQRIIVAYLHIIGIG